MNARRIATLFTLVLLATPVDLPAQGHTLGVGDRVRISMRFKSAKFGDPLIGTVTQIRPDTVVVHVEEPAGTLILPVSSIRRFELHRGPGSNFAAGLGMGLLAGGAMGAALGASANADGFGGAGLGALGGVGIGAAAGAAIGMVVGAATTHDRWLEIPLDNLRIQPSPVAPDGVSLAVSVRWPGRR